MEDILRYCDVSAAKQMCLLGDGYPKPADYRFLPLNGISTHSFLAHIIILHTNSYNLSFFAAVILSYY